MFCKSKTTAMSHNHSLHTGIDTEKFPTGFDRVNGTQFPGGWGAHEVGDQSHRGLTCRTEVSHLVCKQCGSGNGQNVNTSRIGIHILWAVILLCMVLISYLLVSTGKLWSEYEDLRKIQNELRAKIRDCGYHVDSDVILKDAGIERGLTSDDADQLGEYALHGRSQFVEATEEIEITYSQDSEIEAILPVNHIRNKRDDRSKKNQRSGRRDKKPTRRKSTKRKPVVAFHLKADTTKTDFQDQRFVDWNTEDNLDSVWKYFQYSNGVVTVTQTGMYFIYSQLTYGTNMPEASYSVYRNGSRADEKNVPVMSCLSHMNPDVKLHQSCYTARGYYLEENDTIFVSDNYGKQGAENVKQMVNFQSHLSFWGLIKLS